jgi:hypothetical protein
MKRPARPIYRENSSSWWFSTMPRRRIEETEQHERPGSFGEAADEAVNDVVRCEHPGEPALAQLAFSTSTTRPARWWSAIE